MERENIPLSAKEMRELTGQQGLWERLNSSGKIVSCQVLRQSSKTNELGDNLSEYAGNFSKAWYPVSEYFQLLDNGLKNGGAIQKRETIKKIF